MLTTEQLEQIRQRREQLKEEFGDNITYSTFARIMGKAGTDIDLLLAEVDRQAEIIAAIKRKALLCISAGVQLQFVNWVAERCEGDNHD